jgi:hypothetical protein
MERYMGRLQHTVSVVLLSLGMAGIPASAPNAQTSSPAEDRDRLTIVNGTNASIAGFPWQAGLISNSAGQLMCGGSIIGDVWVLTAAHCFYSDGRRVDNPAGRFDVISGTANSVFPFDKGSQRSKVTKVYIHPDYPGTSYDNDIALMRLENPVSVASYATLNTSSTLSGNATVPRNVTVTGWGATLQGGSASPQLLQATFPVVDDETCSEAYRPPKYKLTGNMLCAGLPKGGSAPCKGDSGGPLVVAGTAVQVGVVSWGGCHDLQNYGVFTRVSNYFSWINGIMGWESLGGQLLDAPSCVSREPNLIDCFMRRKDDLKIYRKSWNGSVWSGWKDLGGQFLEAPTCVSPEYDRIDCLARGNDLTMYWRFLKGSVWNSWTSLDGKFLDAPSCVRTDSNRIDCFARGTDQAMWQKTRIDDAWSSWNSLGGYLLGAPSCVSRAPNNIQCFARGADQAMHHIFWVGTWSNWENLGGQFLDGPNCVSWQTNNIQCFARGPDQAMHHDFWVDGPWSGWENLGGQLLDAPSCVMPDRNRIVCFARGTDQAMYYRYWDGGWKGWERLGGVLLEAPRCVSLHNRIDCFARSKDLAMYHWSSEADGR